MIIFAACTTGHEKADPEKETGLEPAEISFVKTEHNLGRIIQGEKVGYTFRFTNTGESALVILDAKAGCGCTVPKYNRKPVEPGGSGSIEVVFDSSGRTGKQQKTVTILSNAENSSVRLAIQADIYRDET